MIPETSSNNSFTNFADKKIAVVGIGGVGGYIAGMLASAYPHVTLAARGNRLESLRENGIVLHSDYHGEIHAVPERVIPLEELDKQDFIFICVKNFSLEEVCRNLKHAVSDHTIIIPVMNGVDPGNRIRNLIHKGTVVDSLIYIVSFANTDYSITQQGNFANLYLGIPDADSEQQQVLKQVSSLLSGTDIDYKIANDIEQSVWRKYILNCAYNVTTAVYDCSIGKIRSNPETAAEYEALVHEAWAVAQAKHISVTEEHINSIIDKFYNDYADDATSSLQRDISAGRTSEFEIFSGYLVKEAAKYNMDIPVTKKMYQKLQNMSIN